MKPSVLRGQRTPETPRLGQWLIFFTLLGAMIVAVQIGRVHVKARIVQLGYALPVMDQQRFDLEDEQARLRIELAALRRLDRVETIARDELHMEFPDPERQLLLAGSP